MSKTWSEKLKKSKIPRTSTGRLPMPKELLEEEESEETRAMKSRQLAEKKKLAEEKRSKAKKHVSSTQARKLRYSCFDQGVRSESTGARKMDSH